MSKDKSNGWSIKHPFVKFMQYQRACYWRHLFPYVWPDARPSPHAAAAAAAAAADSSGEAVSAEELEVWCSMRLKPPSPLEASPRASAASEIPPRRRTMRWLAWGVYDGSLERVVLQPGGAWGCSLGPLRSPPRRS